MKALALALAAALLLAGCASGKDKGDGPDPTGTGTATKTGTSTTTKSTTATGTGSGGPGTIEVDLTRSTPDGAVPLAVNLTLAATFKDARGQAAATPSGVAWTLQVFSGNATAPNATLGQSGTTLPAELALNLTAVGNHTVRAEVTAPGYTAGSDSVVVAVSAQASGATLFFDGAETDGSQWTFESNIWFYEVFTETEQEFDAEHPSGTWEASADEAHSGAKSWYSQYPDNYRARMTSVAIKVPAGGATLSYWAKGGAEANGFDGVHVLVNGAEVALHNAVPEWTQFSHSLAAGDTTIQFRFDADAGCSSDGPPEAAGGTACGAGYNLGGMYLDDVTVS